MRQSTGTLLNRIFLIKAKRCVYEDLQANCKTRVLCFDRMDLKTGLDKCGMVRISRLSTTLGTRCFVRSLLLTKP